MPGARIGPELGAPVEFVFVRTTKPLTEIEIRPISLIKCRNSVRFPYVRRSPSLWFFFHFSIHRTPIYPVSRSTKNYISPPLVNNKCFIIFRKKKKNTWIQCIVSLILYSYFYRSIARRNTQLNEEPLISIVLDAVKYLKNAPNTHEICHKMH